MMKESALQTAALAGIAAMALLSAHAETPNTDRLQGDTLAASFVSPPAEARPHTWWHWMHGNITKEGITADLEAMKRVGVGGAQIFNVDCGIPPGPVKFMSPEWRALTVHAVREADRLGIELCIHNCAGWSSSGGPWNKPEHGMFFLTRSEQQVRGPAPFNGVLAQPPSKLGFYRDIAVLAFRTPAGEAVRMASASPVFSASADTVKAEKAYDGNVGTSAVLPLPAPKAAPYLQAAFAQPFAARQLTLTPGAGMQGCGGELQISDDGQQFRKVHTFSLPRGGGLQTFNFAPVTSCWYRLVFTSASSKTKQIAVAEFELSARVGIDNLERKAFFSRGEIRSMDLPRVSSDELVASGQMVDLTARLGADGRLAWDVPAGDWTLLRLGYTPNGRNNHPAQPEGTGLECDKLSREAAQAHWDGMMGPLLQDMGPLAGKSLNNVLVDSYEVGTQNWTHQFRAEFRKRRGYDLLPYLPVFSDRVVDSAAVTERFLWDFRRTIADLFSENYGGQFADMAHRHNLSLSLEPYGNCPSDDLQYGGYSDIPMGEFWIGGGSAGSTKLAASVAHVYGRAIVGAESFTASPDTGRWQADPYSLKALGDAVFCMGVNRYIFHRYSMQPWTNRWPGMTMGPWGTHFDRTCTWWEQGAAWLQYVARCQFLLQQGRFVGDVLFYCGEGAPNSATGGGLPPGYDYDSCCADVLLKQIAVKDGRLVLPHGMSYRLLVLPNADTMTPAVARKIHQLADAGATIVGPRPRTSPSLTDYPACDEEVRRIVDTGWSRVITNHTPTEALAALGVAPDFKVEDARPAGSILYIHRIVDGSDIYFVSSQRAQPVAATCSFRVSGRQPELWQPETGAIAPAPLFTERDGRVSVPLSFGPAGSVFVVFRRPAAGAHFTAVRRLPFAAGSAAAVPELNIIKATYGVFSGSGERVVDVTSNLAARVKAGALSVTVDNDLAGGRDPAYMTVKELRVDYRYQGRLREACIRENAELNLPAEEDAGSVWPSHELSGQTAGGVRVQAWQPGRFVFTRAGGGEVAAEVATVAPPREVTGTWTVRFLPHWGAPAMASFDKLMSWTERPEEGIKYFSGTATYEKEIDVPAEALGGTRRLFLDLGAVKNLAEVLVNGRNLGILWKPPFCVDITAEVRAGVNKVEVRVTNLWPNRLIGDESKPEDVEWNGKQLKAWPQWLLDGKPSPSGRLTFTTWHHWTKGDPLLESGLLGPVRLREAVVVDVKP